MQLGTRLRELSAHRVALVFGVLLALLAAVLSVARISSSGLEARELEIGAASTQVLIDTPSSKVVDLDATYVDFASLTARADLLGNIMVSLPVRRRIADQLGMQPADIHARAPITANVPRTLVEPGSGGSASDIVASADRYRLEIQADPTVPILRIYSQAPSVERAIALAAASVTALRGHLDDLAARQGIPPKKRVTLQPFGVDRGGLVNGGISLQVALLVFAVVLALWCWAMLLLAGVHRGWRRAGSPSPVPQH